MKTYEEAVKSVNNSIVVISQSGLGYDEKARECAINCMSITLSNIYGVAIEKIVNDIKTEY